MNNEEKILAMLESMSKEMQEMKAEIKELKAGQESLREEMNHRFDELTLAVGGIVNDVCDVMAAREEPIYQALEENRQAINLLARPLVMPAIQKTK